MKSYNTFETKSIHFPILIFQFKDQLLCLQLIYECKEVICAAIIGKDYYQDMTLSVLTADDKSRIESLDCSINEFEEDVEAVLSVRFYISSVIKVSKRISKFVYRTVLC